MKNILIVLALIAGAAAAFWWQTCRHSGCEETNLILHGNMEIRDLHLAFNESEHIAAVHVEEGNSVQTGQLVAELQTDRLSALVAQAKANMRAQKKVLERLQNGSRPQEIKQAQAEVSAAATRLQNAETTLNRLRQTVASGATSEQDVDDAEMALDTQEAVLESRRQALDLAEVGPRRETIAEAEARLDAYRADLRLLKTRLEDASLRAPADGVIQSRILEPGEMTSPTQPVLILALMTPKWVRAYLSEPNLGRVREGMSAEVSTDSYPDKVYDGRVGFISPVSEFTPKAVETTELRPRLVYETRIYVDDPDNQLRLGMPVTVKLPVAAAPGTSGRQP